MKCTKKNYKIPQKSSCGHIIKHLAGIVSELQHSPLSSGFLPKPLSNLDHCCSLSLPASHHVLAWSFKVEKNPKLCHVMHTRPPLATLSLTLPSLLHHVYEPLWSTRTLPVHGRASPLRAIGRNACAETRQKTCQARGERALACLWTRQSTPSTRRPRPPIPLSLCTRTALCTSYLLDMLTSPRPPCRRRHYQFLPRPYHEHSNDASLPSSSPRCPFTRVVTAMIAAT
jgi:hypothetical protein